MKMFTSRKIEEWINDLDEDQLRHISISMLRELIEVESIHFPDDYEVPYWDESGDDLI